MRGIVFSLALLLVAACGSSSKKSDAKTGGSATATGDKGLLMAVYEIREQDGDAKVGTLYKRDHGHKRVLYWVHDSKGKRKGYVTTDNRAFALEVVMGKPTGGTVYLGEDTISACARMVLGHGRAVRLQEIDIDTWARQGTVHERKPEMSKPAGSGDEDAEAEE